MTPVTELIRIQRAASRSRASADQSAFPAARKAPNSSASQRRPSDRQLVAMLLPKSPPMTAMTDCLRRCNRTG